MKTILVTGGAGFIGSAVTRRLIEQPTRVVVVDRLTYAGDLESLETVQARPEFVFCQTDIGDRAAMDQILQQHRPDIVLHVAAESHVDRSIASPAPFVMTNVVGTCQLLDASLHYWRGLSGQPQHDFRFIQISTDEVFGSLPAPQVASADTPWRPNSPYSASKAAGDHFVRAYRETYGLPTLVARCCNNFGPFQFPEKLVPRMIACAIAGQPLPIYGDGSQVREWLYVEDCAEALSRVAQAGQPGDELLIAGQWQLANLQLVQQICDLVDQQRPQLPHRPTRDLIRHVADRPGHDQRYAMESDSARERLQWRPQRQLDDALAETVAWYLNHHDWVRRMSERIK